MPPVTESFSGERLDNLTDGVYFVGRRRVIAYWNRGAERISGYCRAEILGSPCPDGPLRHVDAEGRRLCGDGCPLAATLEDGEVREAEVYLRHRDGHRLPVVVRAAPIRDEHGRILGAVETFVDNSGQVAALRKVAELEAHPFHLSEFRRHGWPFGLPFVIVDHVKAINDAHGHDTGDRVLRTVARSLTAGLRTHDFVGRWGGEAFIGPPGRHRRHARRPCRRPDVPGQGDPAQPHLPLTAPRRGAVAAIA